MYIYPFTTIGKGLANNKMLPVKPVIISSRIDDVTVSYSPLEYLIVSIILTLKLYMYSNTVYWVRQLEDILGGMFN